MKHNVIYLPSKGNSITQRDLNNGQLRITVHAKHIFPDENCDINIKIGNKKNKTKFTKREGRSDIIYIGKEIVALLNLTPTSVISISNTGHLNYTIKKIAFHLAPYETDNIDFNGLLALKKRYWQLLKDNPFPTPPKNGSASEMIHYFKRTKSNDSSIGPYYGITVFEAANRIASDLVIINGLIKLIRDKKEPVKSDITVRLGNKHIAEKGDFTINGKEGEAFNVASSFYKVKLRSTNKKWESKFLKYILINADIVNDIPEVKDSKIVLVDNWDVE